MPLSARSRPSPLVPAVTLAATFLLLSAASAAAQLPPRADPTVHGFQLQRSQMRVQAAAPLLVAHSQAVHAAQQTVRVVPAASAEVQVTVTAPTPAVDSAPAGIAIRGPDGEVREFAVEGGRAALWDRVIVVRPGKSATISVMATPRRSP